MWIVTACALLAAIDPSVTALGLKVSYPDPGNFSYVNLTCTNDAGDALHDREVLFSGDGKNITSRVLVGNSFVVFTFTPQQDGSYICESEGRKSTPVSLAGIILALCAPMARFSFLFIASPVINVSEKVHWYIPLSAANSYPEINLSCPIKPGAMEDRYMFQWRVNSSTGESVVLNDVTHIISINVSGPAYYQCTATVAHSAGHTCSYDGPLINVQSHGEYYVHVEERHRLPEIANRFLSLCRTPEVERNDTQHAPLARWQIEYHPICIPKTSIRIQLQEHASVLQRHNAL